MTQADKGAIEAQADFIEKLQEKKFDINNLERAEVEKLTYQFIYNEDLKL